MSRRLESEDTLRRKLLLQEIAAKRREHFNGSSRTNKNCTIIESSSDESDDEDKAPSPDESDIEDRAAALEAIGESDTEDRPSARVGELAEDVTDGTFSMPQSVAARLYPHQHQGVAWLEGLFRVNKGGILADEMGLGKTLQIASYISGLLHSKLIRRALIIAPKTIIASWMKELDRCGLGACSFEYSGSTAERSKAFKAVMENPGILVTTYGMVQHNGHQLTAHDQHDPDDGPLWDVVAMDEGHKLKNPKTVLRRHIESLPARQRILITGTPIQNNLMEAHSLFDLVCPGLLGDASFFRNEYEKQIVLANDKSATAGERERGVALAATLRSTVGPHMLRREKKNVPFSNEDANGLTSKKKDVVVWLRLTPQQRRLYDAYLSSDTVREALNKTASPLAALTILKKICDHPGLVPASVDQSFDASCKSVFVIALLRNLISNGHRCLLFSQSRRMLDILQSGIEDQGWKFCRIDGDLSSAKERQARVDAFQNDSTIPIFLLTSQVGGLGLTLTAADRVIVVDPAWNPSVDAQSVDRAYRLGQKKDVIVYRLISCGTVEDKIYRKQIFKGGLFRAGTEDGEHMRYFGAADLRDLFRLDPGEAHSSSTQRLLAAEHSQESQLISEYISQHLDDVKSFPQVAGLSEHDALFSKKKLTAASSAALAATTPGKIRCDTTPSSKSKGRISARRWNPSAWSNEDNPLADLLSKALHLEDDPRTFAVPPGYLSVKKETGSLQNIESLGKLIEELTSQRALLQNESITSHLLDGGARVQHRIAVLEVQVQEKKRSLKRQLYDEARRLEEAIKQTSTPQDEIDALRSSVETLEREYRQCQQMAAAALSTV